MHEGDPINFNVPITSFQKLLGRKTSAVKIIVTFEDHDGKTSVSAKLRLATGKILKLPDSKPGLQMDFGSLWHTVCTSDRFSLAIIP